MRILVPVDGSASAGRAAAYAIALAEGRPDAEIILLNVQNQQTLDISDISRVTSVGANAEYAADQSKKALRQAIELCRNAQVKFDTRSTFGPIAETINKIAREIGGRSDRNGDARFQFLARDGSRLGFDKSNSARSRAGNPG